jgi:integrase
MRRTSGEGSVFRRSSDGAWIAQVSCGSRGKRSYRSRSAKSRSEAVRKLRALQAEVAAGTDAKMTTGAYLERWVSEARNIKDTTRSGYADVVDFHLVPALGDIRLAALTPAHVERMLADLSVSPKYARNIHATLRRALGQAVRTGLVPRNVAAREFVDAPRVPPRDPEALSHDEEARLRRVWTDDRLCGLFDLAIGTGLRMGEVLGLAWEDTKGAIHVRKELVRRNGRYERDDPKTPWSVRDIPMTPTLAGILEAHRDRVEAEGWATPDDGPVFITPEGRNLNGSWVTHHFYALCARAGVQRRPFKILRATFSTRLQEAGVPETTIAALMGHTRTHTTKKHYIATSEADLAGAMGRLG